MPIKLLIVDDENTIRLGLSNFIKWDEIDCIVQAAAKDGAEAVSLIRQNPPDIVITDVKMPNMDGLALAKFIYTDYPQIKVVILTGFAEFEYAQTAVQYQVSNFMLKPISKDKLMETVKALAEEIRKKRKTILLDRETLRYLQEQTLRKLAQSPENIQDLESRFKEYNLSFERFFCVALKMEQEISGTEIGDEIYALIEALTEPFGKENYFFWQGECLLWLYLAGEQGVDHLTGDRNRTSGMDEGVKISTSGGMDVDARISASGGMDVDARISARADTDIRAEMKTLRKICAEIVLAGKDLYAQHFSIGISECHMGPQEVFEAVREANRALMKSFYIATEPNKDSETGISLTRQNDAFPPDAPMDSGAPRSTRQNHPAAIQIPMDSNTSGWPFQNGDADAILKDDFLLKISAFEKSYRKSDLIAAKQIVAAMFQKFRQDFVAADQIKLICCQIYYICACTLLQRNMLVQGNNILAKINACNHIDQLESLMFSYLEGTSPGAGYSNRRLSALTEQAVSYIIHHLNEDLSLEMIAKHIPAHASHLSRTFKRDCGQNITDYINQVRIEKAKELLAFSNAYVYEVADQVGFNDPSYFSSVFKKIMGVAPLEFKRLNQR